MKTAKLGSSSNANKNPFSKFKFKGASSPKETFAEIKRIQESKTLELMPPEEWERFCVFRKMTMEQQEAFCRIRKVLGGSI